MKAIIIGTIIAGYIILSAIYIRLGVIKDEISRKVRTNIYDQEEVHHNCTVQILRNSVTGETSFGWKGEESDS